MLEYGKAVQESVYEQLRVVREGQLRIIFTHDLKVKKDPNLILSVASLCLPLIPCWKFYAFADFILGILCTAA